MNVLAQHELSITRTASKGVLQVDHRLYAAVHKVGYNESVTHVLRGIEVHHDVCLLRVVA